MRRWELACESIFPSAALPLTTIAASRCIVARSKDNLEKVAATCRNMLPSGTDAANKILLYAGDICSPDDMVAVRELIIRGTSLGH
jgi:hypothetical protein